MQTKASKTAGEKADRVKVGRSEIWLCILLQKGAHGSPGIDSFLLQSTASLLSCWVRFPSHEWRQRAQPRVKFLSPKALRRFSGLRLRIADR